MHHRVVGRLSRGQVVDVKASRGEWRQLAQGGWVHGGYLGPAGPGAPASRGAEGLVLPHPRWPSDPYRKMLAGFATGSAELLPAHRQWLLQVAAPRARAGQWVFLRGFASRLGAEEANRELSVRRAHAARDFLTQQAGISGQRITGADGIGEAWSSGGERDDSARFRAVEVIVTNGIIQGPEIQIGAKSPLSRSFYIKYLGGGGGGPGFVLGSHGFMIRSPNDWYVRYGFVAAGGSISAPAGYAKALPPGKGWVPFSTPDSRTVDSFEGRAYLRQSGVQLGPLGLPVVFRFWVPNAFDVELESGTGLSITLYEVVTGAFEASKEGPRQGRNWDLY